MQMAPEHADQFMIWRNKVLTISHNQIKANNNTLDHSRRQPLNHFTFRPQQILQFRPEGFEWLLKFDQSFQG